MRWLLVFLLCIPATWACDYVGDEWVGCTSIDHFEAQRYDEINNWLIIDSIDVKKHAEQGKLAAVPSDYIPNLNIKDIETDHYIQLYFPALTGVQLNTIDWPYTSANQVQSLSREQLTLINDLSGLLDKFSKEQISSMTVTDMGKIDWPNIVTPYPEGIPWERLPVQDYPYIDYSFLNESDMQKLDAKTLARLNPSLLQGSWNKLSLIQTVDLFFEFIHNLLFGRDPIIIEGFDSSKLTKTLHELGYTGITITENGAPLQIEGDLLIVYNTSINLSTFQEGSHNFSIGEKLIIDDRLVIQEANMITAAGDDILIDRGKAAILNDESAMVVEFNGLNFSAQITSVEDAKELILNSSDNIIHLIDIKEVNIEEDKVSTGYASSMIINDDSIAAALYNFTYNVRPKHGYAANFIDISSLQQFSFDAVENIIIENKEFQNLGPSEFLLGEEGRQTLYKSARILFANITLTEENRLRFFNPLDNQDNLMIKAESEDRFMLLYMTDSFNIKTNDTIQVDFPAGKTKNTYASYANASAPILRFTANNRTVMVIYNGKTIISSQSEIRIEKRDEDVLVGTTLIDAYPYGNVNEHNAISVSLVCVSAVDSILLINNGCEEIFNLDRDVEEHNLSPFKVSTFGQTTILDDGITMYQIKGEVSVTDGIYYPVIISDDIEYLKTSDERTLRIKTLGHDERMVFYEKSIMLQADELFLVQSGEKIYLTKEEGLSIPEVFSLSVTNDTRIRFHIYNGALEIETDKKEVIEAQFQAKGTFDIYQGLECSFITVDGRYTQLHNDPLSDYRVRPTDVYFEFCARKKMNEQNLGECMNCGMLDYIDLQLELHNAVIFERYPVEDNIPLSLVFRNIYEGFGHGSALGLIDPVLSPRTLSIKSHGLGRISTTRPFADDAFTIFEEVIDDEVHTTVRVRQTQSLTPHIRRYVGTLPGQIIITENNLTYKDGTTWISITK
ncbi:hypothetical protein H6504_00580 [Candidatus Woesearchaeota archaeon]|nr:hypothetical protein [Candidatus Woesearchaeota archaeon]